ncbi:Hypothetical_protein [Hexamita inflata]|uniref:Hypothetical_protein n=1 Tax=Hexamita inflata TaxID=28002 RepID=A0AA86NAA5_9EUKA|nr:Hypothetical protein HINF_LOCUS2944 [Hexamita inflata]
MQRVGIADQQLFIIGNETLTCQKVCQDNQLVTFGICFDVIQFATTLDNDTQICVDPFTFDQLENICVCKYGFYLNGSICVNIINEFSEIIVNISNLNTILHAEIQNTDIQLRSIFYNLEQEIMTNISNLSQLVFETYSELKLDIKSVNYSLEYQFENIITDLNSNFNLITNQNGITQAIINGFKNETFNNFQVVSSKFSNLNVLINDNQLNVKNNFTQTQVYINDLKNTIDIRFSTIESSVNIINTKLNDLKTSQSSFETKLNDMQTYVMNTITTQQQLQNVYNKLYQVVSAIVIPEDPCKQWPGSVNQNGLCKCVFMESTDVSSVFCSNVNQCCAVYKIAGTTAYQCANSSVTLTCSQKSIYVNF